MWGELVKKKTNLLSIARLATQVGCLSLTAVGMAWAQNAPVQQAPSTDPSATAAKPAPAAPEVKKLGEVTVTAEKRSENLEKVPVAVTAIDGTALKSAGVVSAIELSNIVPNFNAMPNANGSTVAIRGIVSTNQTVTGDPEVSYSVDGVPLVRLRDAFQGMYDISRVEVLRGPQGTLYGANANAGGINVITNKPDLTKVSGDGSIGFGNYGATQFTGVLNLPLSDTVAVRFAGNEDRHDGYVNLTTNNSRFDDLDSTGGRIHVLWQPSANFSALLTYETTHNGGAGQAGSGSGAPLGLYATSQNISPYSYATMDAPMSLDQTIKSTTLTLNWSTPWVDITNIASRRTDNWMQSDAQSIYGPLATYCQTTSSTNCYNPLINSSDNRQFSDELRFTKDTDSFKTLVGLYYVKDNDDYAQTYEPNLTNPNQWQLISSPGYVSESKAIFGQTTWVLNDQWSFVGGLRYQQDHKDLPYSPVYVGPIGSIVQQKCITDCTLTKVYSGEGSWSKTTWKAGVNFQATPDSYLFASVATGYEAGGFSAKAVEPFNPDYGPENLTNYELGWKARLFNDRAQINIDGFYMKYSDYQATTSVILDNGSQASLTTNAGSAVIKGIELESKFVLSPSDNLDFNATALSAKFTSFYLPFGDGYGVVAGRSPTNYTGNDLPYAPHFTTRVAYEHTFQLNDDDTLTARVDSNYVSHQWLDYHDYDVVAQKAYTRSGASLTWERYRGGRDFSVQLYVRNIENKAILAGGQGDNSAPDRDFNDYGKNGYYMAPRTYGVMVSASF